MNESVKTALVFLVSIVVGFTLFAAFFRLHLLRGVEIIFYRGLILTALAGILTFACLFVLRSRFGIPASMAFSAAVLSMSLNLSFLVVFPVTIDRSITVFLLSQMDESPNRTFTVAQMQDRFVQNYLGKWNQIDRRMHEQLLSRNVERSADAYKISAQGRSFMRLCRILGAIFDTDPRFVGGEKEARNAP